MTARISHTTVDCRDAYALSLFWSAVLGFTEDADDPNEPGHDECLVRAPDGGQRLLFIEVPDVKAVKNRLHLDLVPAEGTRDEELQRLLELGAREVDDRRRPDGSGWVVLADPEGNEFCILRSDAERAETTGAVTSAVLSDRAGTVGPGRTGGVLP
jgi:catechol 2,3-dioxygenase-like lactoylglutathione lyase family enzyme